MRRFIREAWAIIHRAILPGLLIAAGIASVVYGAMYHSVPVVEEREEEIDVAPPPLDNFGPMEEDPAMCGPGFPPMGEPGMGGPPGLGPPPGFAELPPHLAKEKVTIFVTEDEPEPTLIREVTVGGLALFEAGKLKRTYSGKIPSLCPT